MLVVWSQASVASHWVQDEATRGRDRGILIPAQIDDMELPIGFGMYQTAQLTAWHGDTSDAEFAKITREVTRLIGPPPQTPKPDVHPEPQQVVESPPDVSTHEPQVPAPPPEPQPVQPETSGRRVVVWLVVAIAVIAVGFLVFEPFKKRQVVTVNEKVAEPVKNSIGMDFVRIEAGAFQMGSEASGADDEKPVHWVRISQPFDLSTYEVTQKQWKAVVGDDKNPSDFKGDDRPVESVSWHDVQTFIEKLNEKEGTDVYRLPTEAEWEYAARAGTRTTYHFGDDDSQLGKYAWYWENAGRETHPVGKKEPNAWGLYDMYGNVWEWVSDWYEKYPTITAEATEATAVVDPVGPVSGSNRVIRGGGWGHDARSCRSAFRTCWLPGSANRDFGFRLLREVQ